MLAALAAITLASSGGATVSDGAVFRNSPAPVAVLRRLEGRWIGGATLVEGKPDWVTIRIVQAGLLQARTSRYDGTWLELAATRYGGKLHLHYNLCADGGEPNDGQYCSYRGKPC